MSYTFGPLRCLLLMLFGPLAPAVAGTVWLSSLDLSRVEQGWGSAMAGKSVTGAPLSIGGVKFERGVGSHAVGLIRLDLAGGSESFIASVGVDDDVNGKLGSVDFRLVGDGKTLWKSRLLRGGDPPQDLNVSVRGVRTLLLIIDDGDDGDEFDHADWAGARLEVTGKRPRIVSPPVEKPYILTPKPTALPRLHGPKVYGVRPGSPFLYRIPATGDRPMRFTAAGLPPGLTLNTGSGIITGAVRKRGEYHVTLRARNRRGTDRRVLRIVVGERLALTPPLGWNSWYCYLASVTDKQMRAAADAMIRTGLADHGYQYVNIDDGWMALPGPNARDERGRIRPNGKFPDMESLTAYIHAKGLKAGIYTSPGPQTCAAYEGSWQHEEQDAAAFTDWGFDFLKHDWCSMTQVSGGLELPQLKKPYQQMSGILKRQPRDMVFNLCQYGMGKVWEWGESAGGHAWRTTGDIGIGANLWASIEKIGFGQNGLEKWAGPGHWNDPDYLQIGRLHRNGTLRPTPLSPDEQYAHVSLWALLAAPFIFGGDIAQLDAFTLSLLSNDEVIDVDLDVLGRQGRRVWQQGDTEVWSRDLEDGSKAVGLFNRGEVPAKVTARWPDLKISGPRYVRDLWRQKTLGRYTGSFHALVPSHGVVFVRVIPLKPSRPARR